MPRVISYTDPAPIVTKQLGREPRKPWRVLQNCKYGFPQVIASPSKLECGELFPTWAWLTCPWLAKLASTEESEGACAQWSEKLRNQPKMSARLLDVDAELRRQRAEEGGGRDLCGEVGIAGNASPLHIKCLHAHIALRLIGLNDPIGKEFFLRHPRTCADRRCGKF
ncbi:MAG: DUF501 domain-containing protein [Actinomycetes bacterium]|jgi:hypothetical protein|nr:DUF501 domain-containing protein [Actinomycetes bacterium]